VVLTTVPGVRARAGLRSSRGSAAYLNGRRLSAPTPGTSVPLPGSIGAADHGDTKSARGDLATLDSSHPTLNGLFASPRLSVALTVVYS
jgi:hypothetical protein